MRTYKAAQAAGNPVARESSMFTGLVWAEVLMPYNDGAGANKVT